VIGIFVAALLASAGWCVASSFRRAARANVGRRAGIPVRSRSTIAPERRRRLIGTYAGALGILAALLVLGPVAAVVGALGVVLVPRFMRRRRARAGQSMVESQLAAAVSGVAAALRAGLSLSQSIRFAAAEAEPPVAESLLAVAHREELGVPLEESIARWSDGAASADVRLVADVLRLHVGAGLPRVLDHVCRALRERETTRREVSSLTAQARLSGTILGLLPIGFFAFLSIVSRHDMAAAYSSPIGLAAIVLGLVLDGLAFLWIRKLVAVAA